MSESSSRTPPLSVVMPVLNGGAYLDLAIESILSQRFRDLEFVIFDDGSSDGTPERLRAWAARDPRIRLILGERTHGPVGSSNAAANAARAPLIARMDADDIALPDRLGKQLDLMNEQVEAVLVGTLAETIDARGRVIRPADYAGTLRSSRFAPFPHSSIMFRKAAFERNGGYRESCRKWEDVDLFLRMAEAGRVLTLLEPLMRYRQWAASTRFSAGDEALERAMAEACGGGAGADSESLPPTAFVLAGSTLLWSGAPVRSFGRLLRSARPRFTRAWFSALLWSAGAASFPAVLRAVLRARLAIGNARARRRLGGRKWVEWRPEEERKPLAAPVRRV